MDVLPNELLCLILQELLPAGLAGLVAQVCHSWRDCIPPHQRKRLGARFFLSFSGGNAPSQVDAEHKTKLWEWATHNGLLSAEDLHLAAAATGRLGLLQELTHDKASFRPTLPDLKKIMKEAARGGHLAVLQWAYRSVPEHQRLGVYEETCWTAAVAGHIHVLRWVANDLDDLAQVLHGRTVACAASGGQLGVFRWMKEQAEEHQRKHQGEKLEVSMVLLTRHAARKGHLHVLRWAVEENGYDLTKDDYLYSCAAQGGRLDVVEWMYSLGARVKEGDTYACSQAVEAGDLNMVQWLLAHGGELDKWQTFDTAASAGHLHLLKWVWANGCPWSSFAAGFAAEMGHTEVLRWLYQQKGADLVEDCFFQPTAICTAAAQGGHLGALQYLRLEVKFPWGVDTCNAAISANNLQLLRWMREEADPPCPWDESTSHKALQLARWEMLQWMLEEAEPPCPASQDTILKYGKQKKQ
ncbi:Ankyrin repeat domain-containing protein [Balamuthia mandrillaris]